MLIIWITSFCIGSLLSKFTDLGFVYLGKIAFAILLVWFLIFIFRSFIAQCKLMFSILTAIAAFIWGFSHGAPSVNFEAQNVEILLSKSNQDVFGVNFVRGDNGKIYEVKGYVSNAYYGQVKCESKRSLFNSKFCYLKTKKNFPSQTKNNLKDRLTNFFNNKIEENLSSLSDDIKGFIYSIFLGNKHFLENEVKDEFRQIGAYHLLVVSGIHFAIIASMLCFFSLLPLKLLYIIRIINPKTWMSIYISSQSFIVLALIFYAHLTGLGQATQRAMLIFVVHALSPVLFGYMQTKQRILVTLVLQTIVFPIGIFCEATIMSWAAYLMFVDLSASKSSCINKFLKYFYTQFKLTIIVACCFGQTALIGILANPVLVPLFPVVLYSASVGVIFGTSNAFIRKTIALVIHYFLDLVHFFKLLTDTSLFKYLNQLIPDPDTIFGGSIFLLLSTLFTLGTLKRLSNTVSIIPNHLKLQK